MPTTPEPLKKYLLPVLALVIAIALYNAHTLVGDSNIVYNYVEDGYQYCKIDLSKPDPRSLWSFGLNMAFATTFILFCWREFRSFGLIIAGPWYAIQAAEVYLTGNFFWSDWPDWIILAILSVSWLAWELLRPPILRAMRVVWVKP